MEWGEIVQGRVVYVVIQTCDRCVGVLNIYAPNRQIDRRELLIALMHNLPQTEDKLVARDFNMPKSQMDTSGNSNALAIKTQELHAWSELTWKMQIGDM